MTTPPPATGFARSAPLSPSYDVVVVGARAAGAATAMLLARRGLSVLAVDRSGYGTDTLSTNALALPGVLQLSRWGLLDEIRAAGTPVARTVVFHYGDDVVTIDVPTRGDVDGLYSPRRTVLDARLVDAARAAGADIRHGAALVALTRSTTGRVDGVDLQVDGQRRRVAARFVVGADGLRSRVAQEVGAPLLHQDSTAAASIFSLWEGLPDDTIVNHYSQDQVVGVIPTNDGAAVVWAGLPMAQFARLAARDRAAVHAAHVQRVPELAAQMRGARQVSGLRSFAGVPGFLRQAWGDGWALVGDAGYFKDPVSSHGITDAFIGAELLARALDETLLGDADEREALTHFQTQRDAMAAAMMPPLARVAGFDLPLPQVKEAFRDMSLAMRDEWQLIVSTFDRRPDRRASTSAA